MTPTAFIAKWHAKARNERAASQEHFLDLCALLGEPTPNSDPTGAAYAFEKGATKAVNRHSILSLTQFRCWVAGHAAPMSLASSRSTLARPYI